LNGLLIPQQRKGTFDMTSTIVEQRLRPPLTKVHPAVNVTWLPVTSSVGAFGLLIALEWILALFYCVILNLAINGNFEMGSESDFISLKHYY
jgi:hypothetical protein